MSEFIPLARASISEREIEAVAEALRVGWLTRGPGVARFEEEFARYVGAPEALALSSCTAALHLAVLCSDIGPGDEVIVPTLTFVATANVVVHAGATPVFADVLADTLNLDPASVEAKITPRTKAIIAVHYAGQPCDMEALEEMAARHGLALIEDAAHAVGAEYCGRRIGGLGHPTCCSFYPIKNMTTGEGGMLTGLPPEGMARARRLSLHGLDTGAWDRYSRKGSVFYEMREPGFKYNMTDPDAALGRVQLARLPEFLARRREIAARYRQRLAGHARIHVPGLPMGWDGPPGPSLGQECPSHPIHVAHAWHLFVVQLNLEGLSITRDDVIEKLKERGIGTSVHFIPVHTQPFYRERYGTRAGDCPVAEAAFARLVSLPMDAVLTDAEVDRVCTELGTVTHFRRETSDGTEM